MEEANYQPRNSAPRRGSSWAWIAGTVVVLVLAAFGVAHYLSSNKITFSQQGINTSAPDNSSSSGNSSSEDTSCDGSSRLMMKIGDERVQSCGRPTVGTASVVSDSSITVHGESGDKTFSITDKTKISEQGASKTVADIPRDATVVVVPGDNPDEAGYILINPNMQTPGM